jgi:hypothetical protein
LEGILCSEIGRHIIQILALPKLINQLDAISIKIPSFDGIWKTDSKIHIKNKWGWEYVSSGRAPM